MGKITYYLFIFSVFITIISRALELETIYVQIGSKSWLLNPLLKCAIIIRDMYPRLKFEIKWCNKCRYFSTLLHIVTKDMFLANEVNKYIWLAFNIIHGVYFYSDLVIHIFLVKISLAVNLLKIQKLLTRAIFLTFLIICRSSGEKYQPCRWSIMFIHEISSTWMEYHLGFNIPNRQLY